MPVAYDAEKKKAYRLNENNEWVETKTAKNPQTGEMYALDGNDWQTINTAPAKKKTSTMDEISSVVSGGNEGIADMLGFPVDMVNIPVSAAAEALGYDASSPPIMGSEWIKDKMRALGIDPDRQAETTTGRYARSGARALTAVPAAGLLAGLPGVAPVVTSAMTAAPIRQGVAAIASGVGEEAAVDAFGEGTGPRLIGGLIGGGIPSVVEATTRQAFNTLAPFSRGGQEVVAGHAIRRFANNPTALNDPAQSAVPGVRRTTAEATGDPGLAQLERTLISEDPQSGGRVAVRQAENNAARRDAIGEYPGAAAQVDSLVEGRVSSFDKFQNEILARASAKAEQRIDALGPGVSPEEAGRIIREEYEAAHGQAKRATGKAYDAIDPDGVSEIPTKQVYADIAENVSRRLGEDAPKELQDVVRAFRADVMSFDRLDQLARKAADIAGEARSSGRNNLAATAQSVADRIRRAADDAADAGVGFTKEQANNYTAARATRREQGERFEQGASARVGAKRRFGEPVLTSGEIPRAYWNTSSGSADDADNFIRSIGDRPAAIDALTDFAAGDLYQYAARADGTLDPKKVTAWMKRNKGPLSRFPELQEKVSSVFRAQRLVDDIADKGERALRDVRRGPLGAFLKSDPDEAIKTVLGAKNRTEQLTKLGLTARKTEGGLDALRQAILDRMRRDAEQSGQVSSGLGQPVLSPAAFRRNLEKYRESLLKSGVFSKDHLASLEAVYDDMGRVIQSQTGGRSVGSPTQQNLSASTLLTQLSFGALDPDGPVAAALLRPVSFIYRIPDERVRELLVDAALDPSLAKSLAAKATPELMGQIGKRLLERYTALTGRTVALTAQKDQAQDKQPTQ